MESNPKKLRLNHEGIDRISELPDSILSKILSYLPTKNAVGASILSTRWKNISPFWFAPVKLDLDDSLFLNLQKIESKRRSINFIDFVDTLLNETLSGVTCLEEMILKCHKYHYDHSKIVSWVCSALRLNVRYLNLNLYLFESKTLFHSLEGCTSLVTLVLVLKYHKLFLPYKFSLPNLKRLELSSLGVGRDSVDQFVKGCPALEYLYLFDCFLGLHGGLCIRSSLLKNLVIKQPGTRYRARDLILDLPNLELLICDNVVGSRSYVRLSKSLHTARIKVLYTYGGRFLYDDNVAKIVSACSSTIRLYLCAFVIDCLHGSSVQLPMFQNLTLLSIGFCGLKWEVLARLLQNAPNLEELKLEEGFENNEGDFANFMNLMSVRPQCLALHLRSTEFQVFKGDENEIKLVEYFLKNAEVLQKLILHCPHADGTSLLTTLLMLPRQSKTCQIECRRKLRNI